MDKEHAVHIYSGICNLKEGNNAIYRNMNGPRDYHTKKKKVRQRKTNTIWYYLKAES